MLLCTLVHKFLYGHVFSFLGCIPRIGIAGSDGKSFKLLRKSETVLHSSCTVYIPTSNVRGFQFLHMLTNTCYCLCQFVLITAFLLGVKQYLIEFFCFVFVLLAVPGLSCGSRDLSLWRGLLFVVCGFSLLQLWHVGLVAPPHVGSQFPNQGSNPCPLHQKADSLPLDQQGSPHCGFDRHFLITNDVLVLVGHLKILDKCIFRSFAHLLIRLSFCCCLYILDTRSLSDI